MSKDVSRFLRTLLQRRERRRFRIDLLLLALGLAFFLDLVLGGLAKPTDWIEAFASPICLFIAAQQLLTVWRDIRSPAQGTLDDLRTAIGLDQRPVAVGDIEPCDADDALGFVRVVVAGEAVHFSSAVDRWLRSNDAELEECNRKLFQVQERLAQRRATLAPLLLWKRDRSLSLGKRFFDDRKFALASSLPTTKGRVRFHRGSYYRSFLTNEICTSRLSSDSDDPALDFRRFFPLQRRMDGKPALAPLDASEMDDHVGISTLALTKDRKLILWCQGEAAEQSSRHWVPSGSGSCDESDIQGTLCKTVAAAMQRELREETSLDRNRPDVPVEDIGQTCIVGFYRWVRRGGKPEFIGISRLFFDADEVAPEAQELSSKASDCLRLPCNDMRELRQRLNQALGLDPLSVPLAYAAVALLRLLDEEPSFIESFWFDQPPRPGVRFLRTVVGTALARPG